MGITLAPATLLERIGSQLCLRADGRLPRPERHASPRAGPLGWACEASAGPLIIGVDPPGPALEVTSYLDGSWSRLLSSALVFSACSTSHPSTNVTYKLVFKMLKPF